ncbi:hypothetical protein [Acrocarpospora catenulata]|nr:hypothetical protein [Acrocarpospora catenulata]
MEIDIRALELLPAEAEGLRPCQGLLSCLFTCFPKVSCTSTCTKTVWSED